MKTLTAVLGTATVFGTELTVVLGSADIDENTSGILAANLMIGSFKGNGVDANVLVNGECAAKCRVESIINNKGGVNTCIKITEVLDAANVAVNNAGGFLIMLDNPETRFDAAPLTDESNALVKVYSDGVLAGTGFVAYVEENGAPVAGQFGILFKEVF